MSEKPPQSVTHPTPSQDTEYQRANALYNIHITAFLSCANTCRLERQDGAKMPSANDWWEFVQEHHEEFVVDIWPLFCRQWDLASETTFRLRGLDMFLPPGREETKLAGGGKDLSEEVKEKEMHAELQQEVQRLQGEINIIKAEHRHNSTQKSLGHRHITPVENVKHAKSQFEDTQDFRPLIHRPKRSRTMTFDSSVDKQGSGEEEVDFDQEPLSREMPLRSKKKGRSG